MEGIDVLLVHERLCLLSSIATLSLIGTLSLIFPSDSVKCVKAGRNWDGSALLGMRALILKIGFRKNAVADIL